MWFVKTITAMSSNHSSKTLPTENKEDDHQNNRLNL